MNGHQTGQLKKNDLRSFQITDFAEQGEGVGRADAISVFTSGAVIGDTVRAVITRVKKKYAYAKAQEILSPSPDRVVPRCPVAQMCGGCQIQAYAYPAQLRYKEKKVRALLKRIGHFDEKEIDAALHPVTGMEEPYRFRNKAQVPVGLAAAKAPTRHAASAQKDACAVRDGAGDCASADTPDIVTGYYATHSHRIVPHEDCLIGDPLNADILGVIRSHMLQYGIRPYDEETHTGLVRHVLIRRGFATGEVMVCLVLNRRADEDQALSGAGDMQDDSFFPVQDSLTDALRLCVEAFAEGQRQPAQAGSAAAGLPRTGYAGQDGLRPPCLASVCVNFNPQRTNVILGKETCTIHGKPYIEDVLLGLRFRISAQSFYQTNPAVTERLYETVAGMVNDCMESLSPDGKAPDERCFPVIWDLFCGIGTISLMLAKRFPSSQVYAIEIIPQAIADAKENAALNGIDHVTFLCADAAEARQLPQPDIIVVDPPRKGCDRALLDTILTASPAHIIYVSCDPATLSRDLRILADGGYDIREIRPFDMFPHSVHIETIVLLQKLNS